MTSLFACLPHCGYCTCSVCLLYPLCPLQCAYYMPTVAAPGCLLCPLCMPNVPTVSTVRVPGQCAAVPTVQCILLPVCLLCSLCPVCLLCRPCSDVWGQGRYGWVQASGDLLHMWHTFVRTCSCVWYTSTCTWPWHKSSSCQVYMHHHNYCILARSGSPHNDDKALSSNVHGCDFMPLQK